MALEMSKKMLEGIIGDNAEQSELKSEMLLEAMRAEKDTYIEFARSKGQEKAMKRILEENKPGLKEKLKNAIDQDPFTIREDMGAGLKKMDDSINSGLKVSEKRIKSKYDKLKGR